MSEMCTFFRVIREEKKDDPLKKQIDALRNGIFHSDVFLINPSLFSLIPGSPIIYWINSKIRGLFIQLPSFEDEDRTIKQGLATADNPRFVRIWWEVIPHRILSGDSSIVVKDFLNQTFNGKKWVPYTKGGESTSPYYVDIHLVVNWEKDGAEIKNRINPDSGHPYSNVWMLKDTERQYFFNSGITWPNRPLKRGSFSHVPSGVIFSHVGMMAFSPIEKHWSIIGLTNSDVFIGLLHLLMPRGLGETGATLKYEIGYLKFVPYPTISEQSLKVIDEITKKNWELFTTLFVSNEIHHFFIAPTQFKNNLTIHELTEYNLNQSSEITSKLKINSDIVNEQAISLYHISKSDFNILYENVGRDLINEVKKENDHSKETVILTKQILSYFIGCIFGRWEIRYAIGEKQLPSLPDPFSPLPACSPGMLQGDEGLPLTESPQGYPLNVQWNGILVEDPGHSDDIVLRIREILRIIYGERTEKIEAEACSILGFEKLNDYFRKLSAGGFWDDHIKRYSKSKRKAPIYWKLSSNKGNYSIWLYYHRITKDTLFQILKYVEDKINLENSGFEGLKQRKENEKDTLPRSQLTKLGKEIEAKADFISELKDFKEKIEKIAKRGYDPDFDDGVILNMAPLHEIIPWKEPKAYWEDLEKGKYDWAHIAMKYWPDRVREKCKKDKSIAIAHGLEQLYEAN